MRKATRSPLPRSRGWDYGGHGPVKDAAHRQSGAGRVLLFHDRAIHLRIIGRRGALFLFASAPFIVVGRVVMATGARPESRATAAARNKALFVVVPSVSRYATAAR